MIFTCFSSESPIILTGFSTGYTTHNIHSFSFPGPTETDGLISPNWRHRIPAQSSGPIDTVYPGFFFSRLIDVNVP